MIIVVHRIPVRLGSLLPDNHDYSLSINEKNGGGFDNFAAVRYRHPSTNQILGKYYLHMFACRRDLPRKRRISEVVLV